MSTADKLPTEERPEAAEATSAGAGKKMPASSDKWYTPQWVIDAVGGKFDMDPCAPSTEYYTAHTCFTEVEDGLAQEWRGCVWLNPPFSGNVGGIWLERFLKHGNGILLAPASTETGWFQDLAMLCDLLFFPDGRIQFIDGRPIPPDETEEERKKRERASVNFSPVLIAIGDEGVKRLVDNHLAGRLKGRFMRPLDLVEVQRIAAALDDPPVDEDVTDEEAMSAPEPPDSHEEEPELPLGDRPLYVPRKRRRTPKA